MPSSFGVRALDAASPCGSRAEDPDGNRPGECRGVAGSHQSMDPGRLAPGASVSGVLSGTHREGSQGGSDGITLFSSEAFRRGSPVATDDAAKSTETSTGWGTPGAKADAATVVTLVVM